MVRYLSALENRLHEAEALLGVIISLEDTRAKTLVNDLATDDLAKAIITRITNSIFGPKGRAALRAQLGNEDGKRGSHSLPKAPIESRRQRMNYNQVALKDVPEEHTFQFPSNTWQDHLCQFISKNSSHICKEHDDIDSSVSSSLPAVERVADNQSQEGYGEEDSGSSKGISNVEEDFADTESYSATLKSSSPTSTWVSGDELIGPASTTYYSEMLSDEPPNIQPPYATELYTGEYRQPIARGYPEISFDRTATSTTGRYEEGQTNFDEENHAMYFPHHNNWEA